MCQRVYDFLKCHSSVSKQTNPLQVDDLIINNSVAFFTYVQLLETYRIFQKS